MTDHVIYFLLDLEDMKITFDVTSAQLWQAGGGQYVKISVIEAHEFELAGSDLGISCEAGHVWVFCQSIVRPGSGSMSIRDPLLGSHMSLQMWKTWRCPATVYPLTSTKAIGARSLVAPEGGVCTPAAADATAVTHYPATVSRSDSMEMGRTLGSSTYFYF